MTTILLDSDITAYQFACTNEQRFDWGDGVVSTTANLGEAKARMDQYLSQLMEKLGASRMIVALTDKDNPNWRQPILPSYKMNRKDFVPPVLLDGLKSHLQDRYECFLRPTLEADDVLGILATSDVIVPGHKVIVTQDKDLQSVPGDLYLMRRNGEHQRLSVSLAEADRWHLMQTLTGDPIDNYKGCPGIGAVKAARALDSIEASDRGEWLTLAWAKVVELYESRGLAFDDALVQARVARICRREDYDFTRKEVILWAPPAGTTTSAS